MADRVAITLLRHGLTTYNKEKRYLGWTDIPLNQSGRERLLQVKENSSLPTADLFYSSDLKRCQQTMEILFPTKKYKTDPCFRELNFGIWEGMTYEQLKDNRAYQQWLDKLDTNSPPNGEAFCDFQERVLHGWNTIITQFDDLTIRHIVIISHGGPIRFLLSQFAPTKKNLWEWDVPFGCGYTLYGERTGVKEGKRCTSLQAVPLMEKEGGSTNFIV